MAEERREATLLEIKNFFGMSSADFTKDWKRLSDGDRKYYKEEVPLMLKKK